MRHITVIHGHHELVTLPIFYCDLLHPGKVSVMEKGHSSYCLSLPGIGLILGVSMAQMFGVGRGNCYHGSVSGNEGPFEPLQGTHSLSNSFNLKQKLNVILFLSTIWKGYEVQGPHSVGGNCTI